MDKQPHFLDIGHNATGIIGQNISNAVFINQQQVIAPEAIELRPFQKRSPYKSLKRFDVEDEAYFFGRDELVSQLEDLLKTRNLVLVAGPSGSGKSSLVRAKLVPLFLNSDKRHDFIFTPSDNPFKSLHDALIGQNKSGPDKNYFFGPDQVKFVLDNERNVFQRVAQEIKEKDTEWLIFIDQFEELFTRCNNQKQRTNFIDSLTQIAKEKGSSLKIVLAMRADFMGELSHFPSFWKSVQSQFQLVTEMAEDELLMAIMKPAALHGVKLETGLAKEIVDDVLGQPGALPLMQYTLDRLWKHEVEKDQLADRLLNTANYLALGKVRGALQQHVEKVFDRLDKAGKGATKQIFLALVSIQKQDGVSLAVSKSATRATLEQDNPVVRKTVDILISENLLVSNGSDLTNPAQQNATLPKAQNATIDVTHEILLSSWKRLKDWIKESGDILEIKNELEDNMQKWFQAKKVNEELLKPSAVEKILELRSADAFRLRSRPLSNEENDYINASDAYHKKELIRLRITACSLAGLSFLALGAGGFAWQQLTAARVLQARQFEANHRALLKADPLRSVLTGLAAIGPMASRHDPEALSLAASLNRAVGFNRAVGSIASGQDEVLSLVELKNGELISGGSDDSLRRWKDGKPLGEAIATGQGRVWSLVELKNGELISGGENGSLWGFLRPRAVIQEACTELGEHPELLLPQTPEAEAAFALCDKHGFLKR